MHGGGGRRCYAIFLGRDPDLQSITDLGSLFRSPWKQEFIPLLGEQSQPGGEKRRGSARRDHRHRLSRV